MNHVILRLPSSRALTWAPVGGLLRDMTNTTRTTPTGRTLTLVSTHSDILEGREQGMAHTPLQLVDGVEAGNNLTAQDAPERGVGDTDVVTELGGTGHGAHPAVTDDSPLQVLYEDLETDHVGFHTSRVGPRPPVISIPRGDGPFLGSHINHSGRPMLARQIKNAAHKVTDDELAIELTAIISAKYYAARSHLDNYNGKMAGRVATYLAWVNGTYACADLGELKAAASDEVVIAHYLGQVCEERPIIRTRLYHHLVKLLFPEPPTTRHKPYTIQEQHDLIRWARGLKTDYQISTALAAICLLSGAGLSSRDVLQVSVANLEQTNRWGLFVNVPAYDGFSRRRVHVEDLHAEYLLNHFYDRSACQYMVLPRMMNRNKASAVPDIFTEFRSIVTDVRRPYMKRMKATWDARPRR